MKIYVEKHSKDGLATVKFMKDVGNVSATEAAEIGTELLDKAGRVLKNRAKDMKDKAAAKAARARR